jgi:hypothetical protein
VYEAGHEVVRNSHHIALAADIQLFKACFSTCSRSRNPQAGYCDGTITLSINYRFACRGQDVGGVKEERRWLNTKINCSRACFLVKFLGPENIELLHGACGVWCRFKDPQNGQYVLSGLFRQN